LKIVPKRHLSAALRQLERKKHRRKGEKGNCEPANINLSPAKREIPAYEARQSK
jgi:hypothetical protein